MDSPGGELQTKYHKIAAEYSKVRAQLAVLKKAIIEEQSRNVELKELLREKDQSLRRADLEADSLTFRNEQLTRRVTVLQEELDGLQNQTKAKKNKMKIEEGHQNSEITNHIIDEEFRKKIAENAQLLSLIHEKEESFKNENSYLTSQIEKLEQELNQLRITSLENAESYKNIISELKSEISCIKNDQKQNGQMSVELSLLQKSHSEYELAAETKLNSLNKIIKEQLSFIDSSNEVFNSLNVNCTADSKEGNVSNNSLDDLRSALEQLCTTLANWHSCTALRLCLLPTNKSTVNFKYSKHLNEMNELATELSSSIRFDLVELENDSKISAIRDFSGKLLKYSNLSETLLIHQRLSIEEENGKFNNEISKENNEKLLDNSNQLIKIILQLNSHVAIATKSNIFLQVMENFQRKKHDFIRIFETLQDAVEDLFSTYVTKSTIESDFADQELKQINEDIANCFSMLMISSAKIVCCLQELTKHADNLQVPHTVVLDLKRRATHYINSLQSDEAPSISYLDALKDHDDAKNSEEMHEVLMRQLSECREQFVQSEQDREHWKEEFEVLKLKYSQMNKDSETCSSEKSYGADNTEANIMGVLTSPIQLSKEVEAREQELKKYFQNRIYELIKNSHDAQSKAATFLAENHALSKRLEISLECGMKAERALQEASEKLSQLQEELSLTSSNYETQLSTMSDHLANMNERLAQQKETIDNLEFQISNKVKKGKK